MALLTQLSDASAQAACDAVCTRANGGGSLRIYTGTPPTDANNAVPSGGDGTHVLLATLALSATAFAASAASGTTGTRAAVATANAITPNNAVASGTATWFRVLTNGLAIVFEGTVGTVGSNINMNSNVISSGASVGVSLLTYSIVEAGN